jgi:biotin operon repressor
LYCPAKKWNNPLDWERKVKNKFQALIDPTDRRILDELQRDGALSAADVAARVGLSTTTCWRRIQQLEKSGSMLNADKSPYMALFISSPSV